MGNGELSVVKSCQYTRRPLRSECDSSTPVSTMPMVMFVLPLNPAGLLAKPEFQMGRTRLFRVARSRCQTAGCDSSISNSESPSNAGIDATFPSGIVPFQPYETAL